VLKSKRRNVRSIKFSGDGSRLVWCLSEDTFWTFHLMSDDLYFP
jgi:hypothetical protein